MMRIPHYAALLGMLLACHAQAEPGYWRDPDGRAVQESESMKSKDDFGGSLLAITDEDWEKKWNTPPKTRPNFNKAGVVPYGKKVFILTLFSNPMRDNVGNANVQCDLELTDPSGKVSISQKDMKCFFGQIAGSPDSLYLSLPVIAFSGDPGDPPGTWVVEVKLQDAIRKVELPLRTTFQLK